MTQSNLEKVQKWIDGLQHGICNTNPNTSFFEGATAFATWLDTQGQSQIDPTEAREILDNLICKARDMLCEVTIKLSEALMTEDEKKGCGRSLPEKPVEKCEHEWSQMRCYGCDDDRYFDHYHCKKQCGEVTTIKPKPPVKRIERLRVMKDDGRDGYLSFRSFNELGDKINELVDSHNEKQ